MWDVVNNFGRENPALKYRGSKPERLLKVIRGHAQAQA